jgi:UDP-perosamine 4-acetyltransferase
MTRATLLRVAIIGAGGHAKVVIEAIRAQGGEVLGLVDPTPNLPPVLGVPILGGDEVLSALRAQGIDATVVAIGSNALRERLGRKARSLGFALPNVVHPSALLSPSARLGAGIVVMARAVIGTDSVVEDLAIVNTAATIDHDNEIGLAAHVAPGCALAGTVRIGARALIGIGSALRPGIRVGADAIIGAGSAVVADVPNAAMVGGAPAKALQRRDRP